ncbi:hypothetical protein [Streptomyces erythrochromogenes]|uniref:hypothetical protein n=1 Tax=Streptomyces erythrochromogenes TaxID=285574 RepID=UPI00386586CC|nr:hypothetical protein OG364_37535 [Streptomyces erythrochromogenes]
MSAPTLPRTVRSRIHMLERTLRTDRTAVSLAPPAGAAEAGKREVAAGPPPENSRSHRYLAAGDYWFNNDGAQAGRNPDSLHT